MKSCTVKLPTNWDEAKAIANFDEAKVAPYTLPSPLDRADGSRVETAIEWMTERRPEVLDFYRREVYGEMPGRPAAMRFELLSIRDNALDGTAIAKEIRIHCDGTNGNKHFFDMLLYIPKTAASQKPVPVFLGLNFQGNHTTSDEPQVALTGNHIPNKEKFCESARGLQVSRWCHREVIARGYATATICYHDIYPDYESPAAWEASILRLVLQTAEKTTFANSALRSSPPQEHERYSAIGAWAWGLSRALDCLEAEPLINSAQVSLHGHSRLGKTALWAGANDSRFSLVISNDSGFGGAKIHHRILGESTLQSRPFFPYWFVKNFWKWTGCDTEMPFDQHWLLSLIAPRFLCVASATQDLWADPRGEYLGVYHAGETYRLFGAPVLESPEPPPPDMPVSGIVSYHCRTGIHDQTPQDWAHYLDLADNCRRAHPCLSPCRND